MRSIETVELALAQSEEGRRRYLFALWSFGEPRRATQFTAARALDQHGSARGAWLRRVRRQALAEVIESRHQDVSQHVGQTLQLHALPRSSRRWAGRLLRVLAQQSRAVRDVVWMTSVMDLPKDDVAIALKLCTARVKTLLDAAMACLRNAYARALDPQGRWLERSIATLRLLALRFIGPSGSIEAADDVPLLSQVGWFLVPLILVMGFSEAAITWGLRRALGH